ncbi:disease resistance protein RGA5-like isoform X2 [Triticum dicoccoides]|uniref:disease resistance protein RGA5-like isoform X2 n=1 Tax=Triticum dicoccoides TaxID=85692 RepID=UPI001890FE90|nr:disease resistance protein RGA5-like isoform X2 [Triticum dicoccoides]
MTTFVDSAAVEREMGDGSRCLDPQLWHACAGGMVQMPPVGSRVYYFPQGHAEHAQGQAGTVDFPPGGRIPALVLCRVAAVMFLADPDTDEVFAKIRLVPARPQDPADTDDAVPAAQEDRPASFAKTLTQADAKNGGGFSVPRYCAQTIFPQLDYSADPPVQTVLAKDVHGVVWKFRHIYRGLPRRHLLTTGWSSFVNQKKLVAGDSIVFMRTENGDLCVGFRRAKKGGVGGSELLRPPSPAAGVNYGGFSMFSRGEEDGINKILMEACGEMKVRVRPEEVAEAANLAASGQPFNVLYYPRASTPEFCVQAAAVRAAMRTQWCPGMRCKMRFEIEDSWRMSWFMGTVSAVQVADPIRWPNSPWRLLQVTWDEPDLLQNFKRVSPWLVELVSNIPAIHLAPFLPPPKKLFVPFYPDLPGDSQFPAHPSESGALVQVQRLTGRDSASLPSKAQVQEDQMDEVMQGQSLMPPELLPLPSAPMSWLSLEHGVTPPLPVDTTANDRFEDGLKKRRPEKFRSQGVQTRQIEKRLEKLHTEAPVCAMADAMFRLPAKLDRLLACHGRTLPRGAEDEIHLIKQDLEKMMVFIQEQDDSGAEDRSMMVKCLTKEVRELSYDMEDSVDQYVHAANSRRGILSPRLKKYKITRRKSKTTTWFSEKLKWRLWMANKIREFSMRSQEALQRYSLFNHLGENGGNAAAISGTGCSTCSISDALFGSWRSTPYEEPIGIDAPMEKLEAWLGKDGEQKLKVVSLVGPGGIGKTTLANELYMRIGGQFECRAFVRTSRKPDVRRLLISMLSQIRPHHTPHNWKLHSLIADIRTHLQDKRYLIVIDDVWASQTWDIINRALPAGNLCSGILITTEVDDVALKCCGFDSKYVLTMKQLGHDDSSKLFFRTVFGPQYECPPELSEVGDSIIRKCAGLPLATVTISSLLVNHMGKTEQWHYVNKSLGYGLKTNPTSEGMKQVLNLSYSNLPQHLKPCVMYLSIYEEDYIIQKDDLVKQWVAEGLIHATEEKDKKGISRSYFDQLISSRMILPVHTNNDDGVLSCTVHRMVLDFVTQKSLEENFVTTVDHCQTTASLADKVRRLSLHFGNAEATPPTNMRLSHVRTLAFFGAFKCLPSIVEFGLLQVLILHLWGDDESISFDLTRISELFRLRYLHVTCNATLQIPQTQMRGLQYLKTLKIDARVSAVPSDIVHLPDLLHLSLPVETNLPNGIGRMTSLCTLGYFDLSVNSIDNVQSLGELTNLQDLRLTCSAVPSSSLKSKMNNMGSILAKLSNLRSVILEPSSILDSGSSSMSISCDSLSSVPSPPVLLQRFEWLPCSCTFSSIPKWFQNLSKLSILKIGVMELASNDVDVLRGFPRLAVLSLYVRAKPAERIVFTKTGFSVLKCFEFRCSVPWLEFEVDAMPSLLKLKLGFDAQVDQHSTIPVGILHLTVLKEICVKIGGAGASDLDKRAAESAWIDAIKMHPARPTFNIQCFDKMFNGKDDNNSEVRKEEVEEDSIEKHGVLQMGTREDAHSRTKIDVQTPATMSASAIGTMTAIDECVTYSQWAKSAISSPQSRWSGSQERSLWDGLLHLESGLQLLKDTLPAMYHIIDEAEWRSHEHHVAKLLPNLKDAVSEAEDFLDEFSWYKMKMQAEGNARHSTFIDFFHSVIQGSFINQSGRRPPHSQMKQNYLVVTRS